MHRRCGSVETWGDWELFWLECGQQWRLTSSDTSRSSQSYRSTVEEVLWIWIEMGRSRVWCEAWEDEGSTQLYIRSSGSNATWRKSSHGGIPQMLRSLQNLSHGSRIKKGICRAKCNKNICRLLSGRMSLPSWPYLQYVIWRVPQFLQWYLSSYSLSEWCGSSSSPLLHGFLCLQQFQDAEWTRGKNWFCLVSCRFRDTSCCFQECDLPWKI